MGETTSDYFVKHMNPFIAVGLGAIAFAVALVFQFTAKRYVAWIYWLAVLMVAVFGTMAADVLHVVLGIPYIVSTTFYAIVLAVVFVWWYVRERTLSIHSIYTRHREAFYWATVFATFALGTATGDLTAMSIGWGYILSGVLFAVTFAVPLLGYRLFGWNEVFMFWFAYIVTRPLGASFADWMGKPISWGGLGWGDGVVSIGIGIVILGFVGYVALSRKDIEHRNVPLDVR